MLPAYRLACSKPGTGLVAASSSGVQLTRAGSLGPFIATQDCVLAESALAEYLASLDLEFFQTQESPIHDPTSNQVLHTHRRLLIGQQFPLEWAPNIYVEGDWIFLLGGEHVYVSARLKDKLSESPFDYFEYYEGLSGLTTP